MFLLTSMIGVFVPTPRALASAFPGRIWRDPLAESPSRRGRQVAQVGGMARSTTERQVRRSGMPHAGYASSARTLAPDPTWTYLVRAPQTRHSSHQGNFTDPHFFPLHDHSFIHSHACIHTFIHSFIHSSIHSSHTSKHCICNCCITTLCVTS